LCNGYNGANFVQELGEANTTAQGTDANNNTLALADPAQTLSTRYSDDVYGGLGQTTQTTLSGTRVTRAQ
jgi:hypothetical protein